MNDFNVEAKTIANNGSRSSIIFLDSSVSISPISIKVAGAFVFRN